MGKSWASFPENQEYINGVRRIAISLYGAPKAYVATFGCQQNVSDSEHIKGMLELMGYSITENLEEADFALFNTCAVREHAEDRVYGNIGTTKAIKSIRKNMLVAICGCMAQQSKVVEKIKKSYPYVDILFGTHVIHRLPEFIYKRLNGSARIFETSTSEAEIVEGIPVHRDKSVCGWLPVMYGCNNYCTYCIVPYVRGRERSRGSAEIIEEAKQMISLGIKDITLLGQNVNSYGKGLNEDINFAKLIRKINALDGDFRIRFMTSHPKDCTIELLDAMRDCEKVCRHLHLPFQSGSNKILTAMNRHYSRESYLNLINAARERMPDIQLTSDVIVGFPGETYEDFLETVSLVKQVRFNSLFTFIFSPRTGTPAEKMEDVVTKEEKGKWFRELLSVQEEITRQKDAEVFGKVHRVLCESSGSAEGTVCGKNNGLDSFEFVAPKECIGEFLNIKAELVNNKPVYTVI